MSMFALVSQSLRTGEPMHQVLPTTLIDRLFYHKHQVNEEKTATEDRIAINVAQIQSLDYMYYAAGVVAVYQLLQASQIHDIR